MTSERSEKESQTKGKSVRIKAHELTQEELADFALAVLSLIQEGVIEQEQKRQEHGIIESILRFLEKKSISDHVDRLAESNPFIARLLPIYRSKLYRQLEDRRDRSLTEVTAEYNRSKCEFGIQATYRKALREIAKSMELDMDVDAVDDGTILEAISVAVKSSLLQKHKSKLQYYAETAMLGLLTAGVFELIKWLVEEVFPGDICSDILYEFSSDDDVGPRGGRTCTGSAGDAR